MKRFPLFAVLLLSTAASAQVTVTAEQSEALDASAATTKSWKERLTPASVDPKAVRSLSDKLMKDGQQLQMQDGTIANSMAVGFTKKDGLRNVTASLIELPAEAVEPQQGMVRFAVLRRYFSSLNASTEDWKVDPKTGKGMVHVWIFTVSLDGKLTAVIHQLSPVAPGADGTVAPVEGKAREYRMAPSDPSVLRRWNRLTKDMVWAGRVVEA